MTDLDIQDYYSKLRFHVAHKVRVAYLLMDPRKQVDKTPDEYSVIYHDVPSVMASLICDEDIQTDVLILKQNEVVVMDLGLKDHVSTFTLSNADTSAGQLKDRVLLELGQRSMVPESIATDTSRLKIFNEWKKRFTSESVRIFVIEYGKHSVFNYTTPRLATAIKRR